MKKKLLSAFLLMLLLPAAFLAACGEGTPSEVSCTLDKTELVLVVGEEATLTVTAEGGEADLIWKSENSAVATVSGAGKSVSVTAVAEGETVVTVSVGEEEKCRCRVTVIGPPVVCNVPSGKLVVRKNAVVTVKAWIAETLTDPVTWECSDKSICEIEAQGSIARIKAVKRGECTVTVRCGAYSSDFVFVVGING